MLLWCGAEGRAACEPHKVRCRNSKTGSALLYSQPAGRADREPALLLQSLSLPNYFWLLWKPQGLQRDGAGFAQGCLSRISHPGFSAHGGPRGFGKGPAKQLQKTLNIYCKCAFPHRQRQGKWREIKGLSEQWKFSFFAAFFCWL